MATHEGLPVPGYRPAGRRRIARLTVPATDLVRTLLSLPSSYTVLGSLDDRGVGTVALVVTSSDFSDDMPKMPLKVEVADAGSTRTVRVVPDPDFRPGPRSWPYVPSGEAE